MSGLQSLLKYRFQRKEEEKLRSVSQNGSASQDSTITYSSQGSDTVTPSSSQSIDSIPETPPRQMISSFDSPVLQRKSHAVSTKRGAMVLNSDSDGDASPLKSTNSSPWFSKQAGMANGAASAKDSRGPMYYFAQSNNKKSSGAIEKDEERELLANISALQNMFPSEARSNLVSALAMCDNDIDKATDHLIVKGRQDDSLKRKRGFQRIVSDSGTDSEPMQPLLKKSRPLVYSESQESTQPNSQSQESSQSQNSEMSQEDKIKLLQDAFPSFPNNILVMTLQSKNNDLAKATEALEGSGLMSRVSNMCHFQTFNSKSTPVTVVIDDEDPNEPPILEPIRPIVPQANMGSIKAFQALNKQQSFNHNHDVTAPNSHNHVKKDVMSPATGTALLSREERAEKRTEKPSVQSEADSNSDEDDVTSSDPIVHFLNQATRVELTSMNGCSRKKADVIVEERPFTGWDDLVAKLEHSKFLNINIIASCQEVIRLRGVVDKLMKSCKRISGDMENMVNELTGNTSLDGFSSDKAYIKEQPETINKELKLKPFQLIGLNWLNIMHDQELNGILGDEMGLGKTVQTIAFLTHLLEHGQKGPHIIIAPSSTLDNWLRELKRWSPNIKVIMYYGSQEERRIIRYQIMEEQIEEYHVLVTTYNMASGSVEDRNMFKKIHFHYAVFDEGHMLKNMNSLRYQSLMKIRSERRLVLTGTPLQNNLVELMSLLAFVMPDMFSGKTEHIVKIFTCISTKSNYEHKGGFEKQTIANAKQILKPFFLRRLKRDVLKQLPSKNDFIEKVSMAFEQQELYDGLRTNFSKTLRSDVNSKPGAPGAGASMLMELRKASNHHLLHRKIFTSSILKSMAKVIVQEPDHPNAEERYVIEDLETMHDFELHKYCQRYKRLKKYTLDQEQIVDTGKFRYLDAHLPEMKSRGDRVLVFSQFTMVLDILEEYMTARGHRYLRLDGQTPVVERQDLIDQFNTDNDIFIFLLSTRAGGLGINLTAANVVIIHDIDFNPYNDKQAEDRCHRVGQTKEVTVYKLISKNTVEEAMLRCAQAKLQLEQDITGQSNGGDEENSDVMSLLRDALNIEANS